MSRALATLVRVENVRPHGNADNLELATVRGWQVVVQKGTFRDGSPAIYFEVDSALPVDDPRFAFLASRSPRMFNGRTVHVLRTIKLRGEISQGLLIPAIEFGHELLFQVDVDGNIADVTELLGIELWEPPVRHPGGPNEPGVISTYPFSLVRAPKTDAERVQNLPADFFGYFHGFNWEATEKIDGCSATFAVLEDRSFIVSSRNQRLDPEVGNHVWNQIAEKYQLRSIIPVGVTVQGEIYGEGIQGNPLGIKGIDFAMFAAWRDGRLIPPAGWDFVFETYMPLVPCVHVPWPFTREEAIAQADGRKSIINPEKLAEGIVWTYYGKDIEVEKTRSWSNDGHSGITTWQYNPAHALGERKSFKVLSNAYLLKAKD